MARTCAAPHERAPGVFVPIQKDRRLIYRGAGAERTGGVLTRKRDARGGSGRARCFCTRTPRSDCDRLDVERARPSRAADSFFGADMTCASTEPARTPRPNQRRE